MEQWEKDIRQKLKDNYAHYSMKCLRIRSKSGEIKPFAMNAAQKFIHERVEKQRALTNKVRAIILKGRQQGCSTYIEGRFYWKVTHNFGMRAFILTHEENATKNLFEMAQRYHEHCPEVVKPTTKTSNAKELIFDGLDSGYKLGTAGNKSVGRSSTIQYLHCSEAAFYQHASEHAKGIIQAVPDEKGTEFFIESTANGVGNWFHQQWQLAEAGLSDFIAIFVPWFWQEEYRRDVPEKFELDEEEQLLKQTYLLTDEQLSWRRNKIMDLSVNGVDGKKSFRQEYPCNPVEAFQMSGEDSYIHSDLILKPRKTVAEKYGPLLIGVDPARFGDDRSAIIRRQGRVAFGLEKYVKKDTMELVGIINLIIEQEAPARVFIDIGGLGAGIYDRLVELGHKDILVAVNAGATPLNAKRFYNKRAEMWALTKEWLQEEPCQIPDDDELHADLANPKYKVDSNSRLLIEKKEDMKKRGIRSSDCADALCHTFYLPMKAITEAKSKSRDIAKKITANSRKVMALKLNRKN